jgi:hypothetical protein
MKIMKSWKWHFLVAFDLIALGSFAGVYGYTALSVLLCTFGGAVGFRSGQLHADGK